MQINPVVLRERWVIVNDLPLFVRVNTEAAPSGAIPLVHIHGFAISGRYLVPTAARLASQYPTYVPDLPGFGRSHRSVQTLSISALAETLARFLDVVGVEKAVLVGNSMGCLVTIEFANTFPDRIERAILVSPAGGPHNWPLVRGLQQLALDSMREPPRMLTLAISDYLRFGLINSLRLFRVMTTYPTPDRFNRLTLPVLIVVGVRDPLISKIQIKQAADLPPNITMVLVNGAAHAVNYSHPDALARVIRTYLDDRPLVGDSWTAEGIIVASTSRPADTRG
jgi:pimeloyl-ACP methyl ester carboxylesterase